MALEAKPPDGPPCRARHERRSNAHSGATWCNARRWTCPSADGISSWMRRRHGTTTSSTRRAWRLRVYEMSIGDGQWKLWREENRSRQRFTATISDDGKRSQAAGEGLDGRTGRPTLTYIPQDQVGRVSLEQLTASGAR